MKKKTVLILILLLLIASVAGVYLFRANYVIIDGTVIDRNSADVVLTGEELPDGLKVIYRDGEFHADTFEELRAIIDRVEQKERLGICLDTCHVYDGGYDIVNDLDGVLQEFDAVIGLERLKAIHLNDSKNPMGSHKDRHEKIGEGTLTLEGITRIINHPKLIHLPFYLETPNEAEGYAKEIALLKEKRIG